MKYAIKCFQKDRPERLICFCVSKLHCKGKIVELHRQIEKSGMIEVFNLSFTLTDTEYCILRNGLPYRTYKITPIDEIIN